MNNNKFGWKDGWHIDSVRNGLHLAITIIQTAIRKKENLKTVENNLFNRVDEYTPDFIRNKNRGKNE